MSQIAKADDSALTNAVAGLLLKRLVLSTDLIDKGVHLASLAQITPHIVTSASFIYSTERIGESVWRHAQAHAAEAVETMQGCYTLAALLDPCQPPALRTAVATVLARLALPAPDAQGEYWFGLCRCSCFVLTRRNSSRGEWQALAEGCSGEGGAGGRTGMFGSGVLRLVATFSNWLVECIQAGTSGKAKSGGKTPKKR